MQHAHSQRSEPQPDPAGNGGTLIVCHESRTTMIDVGSNLAGRRPGAEAGERRIMGLPLSLEIRSRLTRPRTLRPAGHAEALRGAAARPESEPRGDHVVIESHRELSQDGQTRQPREQPVTRQ